ncbi:MAG: hypothetical protein R3E88_13250 [Myxococcota bacterium]
MAVLDGKRRRIAAAIAAAALAGAVGCATPSVREGAEAMRAEPPSRCAPGAVLDARHALCHGASGRWW